MKKENKLLMREAREALSGKWGLAVGVCLLYMVILIVVRAPHKVFGPILSLLISGPMTLGLATFSLTLLVAYLLMVLFILLWFLLLIVPGIIAGLAYSQTFYILADDKSIKPREAIRKSKAMMYGHKKKLFYLGLRFLGWVLLCILSAGIGFLWLIPYIQITMAKFYDDISGKTVVPNPA